MTHEEIINACDKIVIDMPMKLHREGKNVIGRNPSISKKYCYMITPDKRAYLVGKNLEKIRELTSDEYKIMKIERYND